MKYTIMQLRNIDDVSYAFMPYSSALKHNFSMNDYDVVYEGEIVRTSGESINHLLEDIFTTFNIKRPSDFRGHSLSTSDIIVLNDKAYYVDWVGFQEIK